MKILPQILLAVALAIVLFMLGKCSKSCPVVEYEQTTTRDTTERTATIEVDPIPGPVDTVVKKIYLPTTSPEQLKRLAELNEQLAYFRKVVTERERVIRELEASLAVGGGVGAEIPPSAEEEGRAAPKGPASGMSPNDSIIIENQLINLYSFEETDTTTGVRLIGAIGVLGFLSDTPPPQFGLVYPEYFSTTKQTNEPTDKTRNRAIGFALANRYDWQDGGKPFAGLRLHYRTGALFVGAGVWGGYEYPINLTAGEVSVGAEIGWRKKR